MSKKLPPVLREVEVVGELVTLRPVRAEDAKVAFPMIHRRREVLEWLVWQGPDDEDELADVYSRWVTRTDVGTNYHFAVVESETQRFCGTIGVRFVDHPWVGDVGYWLASEVWGQGFGTEANFLAAHIAFRHLQSTVLTAEVFVGNEASARVLENNGYEREHAVMTRALPGISAAVDRRQWVFTLTRQRFEVLFGDEGPIRDDVVLWPDSGSQGAEG